VYMDLTSVRGMVGGVLMVCVRLGLHLREHLITKQKREREREKRL